MNMLPRLAPLAAALFLGALASACKGEGSSASSPGDAATADRHAPAPASSKPVVSAVLSPEQVASYVNPAHLPVYEGPTGSVEGTVTIVGDPSPDTRNRNYSKCPSGAEAYQKLFREGPPLPDGSRAVADVLVVVTGYSGAYLPEQKPNRNVDIEDCKFSSRTIDVTLGQNIVVTNKMNDKIFAPAFMQMPSALALIAPAHGDPVTLYPQAPGLLTLFDRFGAGAAYLTADVYVLVQPLHTVTDLAGHYRIDGIPVGEMKVNALLGVVQRQITKTVTVKPGLISSMDLQLAYKAPAPSDASAPTPEEMLKKILK